MRQMTIWVHVNGAITEAEQCWATQIGMKAYDRYTKLANKFIIPVYNWIWDHLYPNTKDYQVEHPNYDRIYKFIADGFCNSAIFLMGGYDYKTKRKVYVNVLYNIKQNSDGEYMTNDWIYVKDFKED